MASRARILYFAEAQDIRFSEDLGVFDRAFEIIPKEPSSSNAYRSA
jgi:hypothetical protein